MKKMMIALACVASAGLLVADGYTDNLVDFENYTLGFTGLSENNDQGLKQSPQYWLYTGTDVTDGSSVKTYAGSEVGTPTCMIPSKFTSVGNRYLELSTEGGTLWRSASTINTDQDTGATWQLGTPVAVPDAGFYVDTLVQFTPTEDGADPDLDAADKLAIWLDVNASGETNLVARGAQVSVTDDGAYAAQSFTFKLVKLDGSPVVIDPSVWYRLTVKAVKVALDSDGVGTAFDGYQIYLDGVQLKPEQTVYSQDIIDALNDNVDKAPLQANTIVQSLSANTEGFNDLATFQAIGFRGTGALDCLAFTTDDPFANVPPAPTPADWPDDSTVAALSDSATAGSIGITDAGLAALPAKKLATWAKANGVSFNNGAPSVIVEAYLLNVANTDGAVATAKADFKIPSITVAANGTVTVADPTGTFNGTIIIKGATTVDSTDWHAMQDGDKFFKAFLVP